MAAVSSHPYRFGFVMEQTLGNVTHYKNLRAAVDAEPGVEPSWYPLPFPPYGGLETLPGVRNNWSVRSSLRARRLLVRDEADRRYDALYFHTQVTTLLCADVMRRVPAVISLDATPLNYDAVGAAYGHHPSSGPAEALKRRLNMRPLRAARALVAFCDWARRSLVDDYGVEPGRVTVIPPGVDLALWPRPAPRAHDGSAPLRLLFVGGDFARKGGPVLLDAFTALRSRCACELHLVTSAAVAPARGVRVYRGLTPNSEELRRLYRAADLFVLPTLADIFPHVVQEAMAAGLPVVASDVGAISEAVRNGETGLLTPPGDTAALAAALDRLAGDAALRRVMGARGRAWAEQEYDSAANARRILAIMRGLRRGDE